MLLLRGCPYAAPNSSAFKSRIKRLAFFTAWNVAVTTGSRALQNVLLPRTARALAAEWGLELISRPPFARSPGFPSDIIPLVKRQRAAVGLDKSDASSLDRLVVKYFGEWGAPSSDPNAKSVTPVVPPATLLAGVDRPHILVLSPHPDDELIGCGGTLMGLVEAGARVAILQMTEGSTCLALRDVEPATRRRVRWTEAQSVADKCGFTNHYWETGDSGLLENNETYRERLRALFRDIKPAVVFIPAATDRHPEHRLAHRLFQCAASALPKDCKVFEYPVWGFLPQVGLAVDVSQNYPGVLDALYLYKTAMKAVDYASRCHVLARWNGSRFSGNQDRLIETFAVYNERRIPS
jgi:LmbE family N-acetylglucosaminyl deacetylase